MNAISIKNAFLMLLPVSLAMFFCSGLTAQTSTSNRQHQVEVYSVPEQGGPRRFVVTGVDTVQQYKESSMTSAVVNSFDKDDVLTNLGCKLNQEVLWCKVQQLNGGAKGYVLGQYLDIAVGPDGKRGYGVDTSRKRARERDFDDSTHVACAQIEGQALSDCSAAVARSDGGDATVVVTFSNNFSRSLFFKHGMFVSANATMSGVGTDTEWTIDNDLYTIRVDDQRYEVPMSFVVGN